MNEIMKKQIEFHKTDTDAFRQFETEILPVLEKEGYCMPEVLSKEDYHLMPGWNNSKNKQFMENPYSIQYFRDNPGTEAKKKCFEEGRMLHGIMLEGETYKSDEDIVKKFKASGFKNRSCKIYKDWAAEQPKNCHILAEKEAGALKNWAFSAKNGKLFEIMRDKDTVFEQPIFMVDPRTGLIIKCCPDFYNADMGMIGDAKFVTSAMGNNWSREVTNYRYDLQQVHYLKVVRRTVEACPSWGFAFFHFVKDAPFPSSVKAIEPGRLASAAALFEGILSKARDCYKSGNFGKPWSDKVEFCKEAEWQQKEDEQWINNNKPTTKEEK